MSITKVNPPGWGVGDKLTAAQANGLDANTTYALDKRTGQTDTLASVVTASGAGRIIEPAVVGANADTTYLVSGLNRCIVLDSSISANRIYTLSHTDAAAGDRITVFALTTLTKTVTVKDATGPTTLYVVRAGASATFVYHSSAWRLAGAADDSSGVVADITALAAIPAPADGLVRHVLGFGWYVFKTSATTGLSPFRVAAGDATAGGWLSSTAYETSLVRLTGPTFLPCYQTNAAATPALDIDSKPATTTDIAIRSGAFQFVTVVTAGNTASGLLSALDSVLVDGATLTQIRMRWKANPTHTALPTLMPKFGVARVDYARTVTALLSTGSGLAADASATFGAYNAEHWNTFTPDQNNVIDKTAYGYFLVMFNEGGTDALASSGCYSIEVTQTIADARRG